MEWISVKDELPERGKSVLVREEAGEVFVATLGENDKPNSFYFIIDCRCYDGSFATNVTHWMPLPELPKGEK